MSNYSSLKATINANIKQNGNQEITGSVMNSVLIAMVNSLGAGYQFMGVATPSTNPGTPDSKVFYLASTAGTYTNFGGLVVKAGEVALLKLDTTWSKDVPGIANADEVKNISDALFGDSPQEYSFGDLVNAIISTAGNINATSPRCGYYIPLLGGEPISGRAQSGKKAYYCCVKSIVTQSGTSADLATGWTGTLVTTNGGAFSFTAPEDARYLYIGHIVASDASAIVDPGELVINNWDVINQEYVGPPVTGGLVDKVAELEEEVQFHGLLKFRIAEHNEGGYNYGESPAGLPETDYAANVAEWKELETKINSDFLALTEHSHTLDAAGEVDSYTELYQQFYPYKYDGESTHKYALFSKYPIKSRERLDFTSTERYADKILVDVNGIEICIIVWKGYVGVPGSAGATSRVAEFTEIVNAMSDVPIVIIPIDTNSQYTEDFDVFRNNGYQLANFGYWGEKITCGISESYPSGRYAFDNIIVKGMNINSFDVCDVHATSDHYPTTADLSVFIP